MTTDTALVFISVSKSQFGVGEMLRVNPSNKKNQAVHKENKKGEQDSISIPGWR